MCTQFFICHPHTLLTVTALSVHIGFLF